MKWSDCQFVSTRGAQVLSSKRKRPKTLPSSRNLGLLLPAFPSPPWVRNHDCSFSQVLQKYIQSTISTKLTNFTQSKPNNAFLVNTFKSCVASQVPLNNSIQLLGIVSNKATQPRQHPHMATSTSKNRTEKHRQLPKRFFDTRGM